MPGICLKIIQCLEVQMDQDRPCMCYYYHWVMRFILQYSIIFCVLEIFHYKYFKSWKYNLTSIRSMLLFQNTMHYFNFKELKCVNKCSKSIKNLPLLFSSIKIGLLRATGLSLLEFSTIANLAPECYIKHYFHSVHIATKTNQKSVLKTPSPFLLWQCDVGHRPKSYCSS